jgi:hypothetical protein
MYHSLDTLLKFVKSNDRNLGDAFRLKEQVTSIAWVLREGSICGSLVIGSSVSLLLGQFCMVSSLEIHLVCKEAWSTLFRNFPTRKEPTWYRRRELNPGEVRGLFSKFWHYWTIFYTSKDFSCLVEK